MQIEDSNAEEKFHISCNLQHGVIKKLYKVYGTRNYLGNTVHLKMFIYHS